MSELDDGAGYCPTCKVVVSRYHADNQGEFHPQRGSDHPDFQEQWR